MNFTQFGEYKFSQLTLGTAQLGLSYGISNNTGIPASEEIENMLRFALESGINTLDTARTYGTSEGVLGQFIQHYPHASNANLVTKFRIAPENLDHPERAWAEVLASVRRSVEVLKVPLIPVCLLHKSEEPMDKVMKILPQIIRRLKEEGLISIGGISAYFPEDVPWIADDPHIEAIQIPLNIFDQRLIMNGSLENLAGKLVFVRSVFLQGLFFMKPDQLTGNLKKAGKYLSRLNALSQKSDMSVAQMAFSFVRDLPGINSIIFGATDAQQIRENVALLHGTAIPAKLYAEIRNAFADIDEEIITPGKWRL